MIEDKSVEDSPQVVQIPIGFETGDDVTSASDSEFSSSEVSNFHTHSGSSYSRPERPVVSKSLNPWTPNGVNCLHCTGEFDLRSKSGESGQKRP